MMHVIEFIKTAFPNSTEAFIYIALILFTLWMYKETRNSYLENTKLNQQRTDKALDCYSELELEVYKYLSNNLDFFNVAEKMAKASSIMPYELLKECSNCKKENDNERRKELIKEFQIKLNNEIVSLKLNQTDPITFKYDNSVEFIENYLKTKIAPFVYPLIQTFYNLILMLVAIYFIAYLSNESSNTQKTLYISLLFAVVIYAAIMNLIVSMVILKKRFNHSFLNWLLFSIFVLSPISFFIGPWYRGIAIIILMIIYVIYAAKKSIKESGQ